MKNDKSSNHSRAQLHPDLTSKLKLVEQAFEKLKASVSENLYVSVWAERRLTESYRVNTKSHNIGENLTSGIVLRVFDGVTLFEEALVTVADAEVMAAVERLVIKVKKALAGHSLDKKVYASPNWSQRLTLVQENEIISQIPKNASAKEWVHFGTMAKNELWSDQNKSMSAANSIYNELTAADPGLKPDYTLVQLSLGREDFVFIDESVRMSQTILRNYVRLVVMKNGERGLATRGGIGGAETVALRREDYADAYKKLSQVLNAERLTPGRYVLLMGPDVTGVFAHEAFGHTQEGDTWARGRSKAREMMEKKIRVGNELATILNNPAVYQNGTDDFAAWGSYYFDEEGWLASSQVLVDKGYLNGPMTNLSTSVKLNMPRTANGRRECWSHGMYVRQTNTYFSPGDASFKSMLESVKYGFLAMDSAGGMEDPKGMGIQVGICYLEEIKDGRLTGKTFKGPNGGAVQMTGYVPDYLNQIKMKSKINAHEIPDVDAVHPENLVGGCGKYHKELVTAGCGGPYMIVDNVLLG